MLAIVFAAVILVFGELYIVNRPAALPATLVPQQQLDPCALSTPLARAGYAASHIAPAMPNECPTPPRWRSSAHGTLAEGFGVYISDRHLEK
jgi:hypothetical protein